MVHHVGTYNIGEREREREREELEKINLHDSATFYHT